HAPGPFKGMRAPSLKEGPTGAAGAVDVEGSGFEGVPPGLKGGGRWARTSAAEHARSAATATTVSRLRILRKSYRSARRAGSAGVRSRGVWYKGERGMATHDPRTKALVLHPDDDVVIAKAPIPAGTVLDYDGERIEVQCDIRPGHKVARRARGKGETVRRYGQVIGFATQPIAQGEHVHTHRLPEGAYQREYEVGGDVRPVDYYPADQMRYFDGFKRADGRRGSRKYVAVTSTVDCSRGVCHIIAERC